MTDQRKLAPRLRARPIKVTPSLERRFWAKVDTSGGPSACWMWKAKAQCNGYGVIHEGGDTTITVYAHRVSYAIHRGDPGPMLVCHRCDTPGCVNPAHLFLGTEAENAADCVAKGRKVVFRGPRPPGRRRTRGPKLDADKVRAIRASAALGETSGPLSRAFGVDSSTIRMVVRRDIWPHVA